MITALLLRFGLGEAAAKILGPILVLAAILASLWGYGEWKDHEGYVRGKAEIQAKLDEYTSDVKVADKLAEVAHEVLLQAQADEVADLKTKIDALEARKPKVITVIKEVTKYVTPEADAKCIVPDGAVWVLDLPSVQERGGTGLSESGPKDVDKASGIALSGVVATTAGNLEECTERGAILGLWQDWYVKSQAEWIKFKINMPPPVKIPK